MTARFSRSTGCQYSLLASCVLSWLLISQGWAQSDTTRQLKIKLVDDAQRPIVDGLVVATLERAISGSLDDAGESELQYAARLNYVSALTDASGEALLEFSGVPADQPTANPAAPVPAAHVTVWKAGWAPRGAQVVKQATLQLQRPVIKPLRIQDEAGRPLAGVKVSLHMLAPLLTSRADWQAEYETLSDAQGLARLPVDPRDNLRFNLQSSAGKRYHALVLRRILGSVAARDARDLVTLQLKSTGSIVGRLPESMATDYQPHLHSPRTFEQLLQGVVSINPQNKIQSDGQFRIDNVWPGTYAAYLMRREPYRMDEEIPEQLTGSVTVDVESSGTAQVNFTRQPAARLSGRVIASDPSADLSRIRVVATFNVTAADGTSATARGNTLAQCNAAGEYQMPLLPGKYRIMLSSGQSSEQAENWRSNEAHEVEVGQGAATISAPPLRIERLQSVPVQLAGLSPARVIPPGDGGWTVRFKSGQTVLVVTPLSTDGLGEAALPANFQPTSIQLMRGGLSTATSLMVDRDPGAGFDLAIDDQTNGKDGNISARGRVVDVNGHAVPGRSCRLAISIRSEKEDSPGSSVTQNLMLDDLETEADGALNLPPTQLLSNLTIPANMAGSRVKITLTLTSPPFVQQSTATLEGSLNDWDQHHVVLPDLVLPAAHGAVNASGRVTDTEGRPLAGHVLWLSQSPRSWRTITGEDGQFDAGEVTGPLWIMCQSGWAVRRFSDLSRPIELVAGGQWAADKSESADAATDKLWQPIDIQQRKVLAEAVIDRMDKLPGGVPVRNALPRDAYLEPDKYFRELLVRLPQIDPLRMQFANFWTLSDQQLEQLADATVSPVVRASMLWTLARRHPSREAYAAVMECYEVDQPQRGLPIILTMMGNQRGSMANVALELYRLSALDPYRGKLEQALLAYQAQMDRAGQDRQRVVSTEELTIRALLDPQAFAEQMQALLATPDSELTAEQQSAKFSQTMLLLRMAPHNIANLPAPRVFIDEAFLLEMGRLAPVEALAAFKNTMQQAEAMRWILLGAMQAEHPEAAQLFQQLHPAFLEASVNSQLMMHTTMRTWEMPWVRAATAISPELGRQAAWQLAHKFLSGQTSENLSSVTAQRSEAAALEAAYALVDNYPEVASEIIAQRLPRFLHQVEQNAAQPFMRRVDLSVAAYFAPEQVTQLLEKLSGQLEEELKQTPNKQPYSSKMQALREMYVSCLRGLLLSDLINKDQ